MQARHVRLRWHHRAVRATPTRHTGPSAATINRRCWLSRRAAIKGLSATGLGALSGAAVYGTAYERHQIGTTEVVLPVSGLPAALNGLRIGFLTDIHHSGTVPAADVAYAVGLVLEQKPDLIVLGGDYVTFGDRAFVQPVAELLAPLQGTPRRFCDPG